MKEVFYEESARILDEKAASFKYNILKIVSVFSYVMMIIWILLVYFCFNFEGDLLIDIIIVLIPMAIFFLSGFFFGKFKNKQYVEYDYTFVSGSIRVAKVIKNIKRSFILKFDTSNIEKIGEYDSGTYKKYASLHGISQSIFTSNYAADEGKKFYYIVANVDGEKKLMIYECTETFIVNILKFTNKSVLEEEFSRR